MLKLGLIGLNRRGRLFPSAFPKELAVITGAADVDPEAFKAFQSDFPEWKDIRFTCDYRELLKSDDVDAVCIIVRDFLHEEIAIAALNAGKAVFLEKPMAITVEGCDRILEAAYRNKAKLFIGHNMRYMPMVEKLKEVIDSGIIGEIQAVWVRHFISYGSCYFRHWCAEQKNCTGLLLQKGAHDIDVIHYLCGSYSNRVVGMGKLSVYNQCTNRLKEGENPDRAISFNDVSWPPTELKGLSPKLDIEDHSMLMMQLDNGIQASYEQCMYTPDSERNYTFIGTRGRVENIGDSNNCEVHVWTQRGSRRQPDIIHYLKPAAGGHGGADPLVVRDFINYASGLCKARTSPIAARNAVAAGCLGHYSMRNGNTPQEIPPLPQHIIDYFS